MLFICSPTTLVNMQHIALDAHKVLIGLDPLRFYIRSSCGFMMYPFYQYAKIWRIVFTHMVATIAPVSVE